jgi:hypothetical protein
MEKYFSIFEINKFVTPNKGIQMPTLTFLACPQKTPQKKPFH